MNVNEDCMIIRELDSMEEFKQAEDFQRLVWGQDDPADNADLMLSIAHEGGLLAGAFLQGRMLGFLFAFPTSTVHIQHSHRLGVHPDSQGRGLGVRLKHYQRRWCLQHGITVVRWTYDPLLIANATLNIARLGATAGHYLENYYGQMLGINAGVPSDRLMAEWQLDSASVERRLQSVGKQQKAMGDVEFDGGTAFVEIPENFGKLMQNDRQQALLERLRVRSELQGAFSQGLRIVDFDPIRRRYCLA